MPVQVGADIRRMDDEEYKSCVYEVMRQVFAVHNDLGRLFDERIYQRELAFRIRDAQREVPLDVRFEGYCKRYFLDLLVAGGALFELKTASALAHRHRDQLLRYLFLTGLPHGKLVNLRTQQVEHEFVNNALSHLDRVSFTVVGDGWEEAQTPGFRERVIAVLHDWGTGLDLVLYEEVAAYLCGQLPEAEIDVEVRVDGRSMGFQRMRLAAPGVAICVTALPGPRIAEYRAHLGRFVERVELRAIQWINVTRSRVLFTTVSRKRR